MSREAFEAYKRSSPLIGYTESVKDGILKKNAEGYYLSDAIQSAWLAWQAAESHTARECFKGLPQGKSLKGSDLVSISNKGFNSGVHACAAAIRAAYPDAFKD